MCSLVIGKKGLIIVTTWSELEEKTQGLSNFGQVFQEEGHLSCLVSDYEGHMHQVRVHQFVYWWWKGFK